MRSIKARDIVEQLDSMVEVGGESLAEKFYQCLCLFDGIWEPKSAQDVLGTIKYLAGSVKAGITKEAKKSGEFQEMGYESSTGCIHVGYRKDGLSHEVYIEFRHGSTVYF